MNSSLPSSQVSKRCRVACTAICRSPLKISTPSREVHRLLLRSRARTEPASFQRKCDGSSLMTYEKKKKKALTKSLKAKTKKTWPYAACVQTSCVLFLKLFIHGHRDRKSLSLECWNNFRVCIGIWVLITRKTAMFKGRSKVKAQRSWSFYNPRLDIGPLKITRAPLYIQGMFLNCAFYLRHEKNGAFFTPFI